MAVKIEFATSNAVFAEDGYGESALILHQIADAVERAGLGFSGGGTIRDSNGNKIGSWKCIIDAENESGE